MRPLPIIDMHVHVGTWQLEDLQGIGAGYEDFNRMCRQYHVIGAAVTTTDGPEDCITRNRALLEASAQDERSFFFPWVHILEPGILEFLDAAQDRIRGFKVHPAIDHVPFDDPAFEPLLARAAEWRVPILVHCGHWKEMTSYEKVLPSAEKHPEIDFILAHTTGGRFGDRLRGVRHLHELKAENLYVDITGTFRWKLIMWTIELLTPYKIVFGSDYPLGHPSLYRGLMEAVELSREEREAIYFKNAQRLLGKKRGLHQGHDSGD